MLGLSFGFGVAAALGAMYLFDGTGSQPQPTAASETVAPPPVADAVPPPAAAPPAPTFTPPAPADPPPTVEAAASATAAPAPATAPRDTSPLAFNEIVEVQVRLRDLGMNPGRADGVYGPKTAAAIRRYEEAKGRPQTGYLDRETLKQLRADPDSPAPQVKADPPYQPQQ
jgi:peptidoglycan hydrolase-like protein with peptidoglycan-binding domain